MSRLLSTWEGLPVSTIMFVGVANLTYGTFSLYVTTRKPRPILLVKILAVANMTWLAVCFVISITWWNQITGLGLLHIMGEGIYVAGLGFTEWRWRNAIAK